MQTRHTLAVSALCGLAALGCASGATPTAPLSTPDLHPVAASASGPAQSYEFAAGGWQVDVDLATMSAEVTGIESARTGQFNGDLFGLAVDQFFGGDALQVTGVSINPDGNLVLECAISHPFSGPSNLAGPPSASNRADLGICGRYILHAGVPATLVTDETQSNHTGDYHVPSSDGTPPASANPKLLVNADGFWNAGNVATGGTARFGTRAQALHPYKVLVDESISACRTSTSSGNPILNESGSGGNFDGGGWTAANIGSQGQDGVDIQWTGYGMLHQGQTTHFDLEFDIDELAAISTGTFSFESSLVAKYVDPRTGSNGAQLRANRLPGSTTATFTYRMPYAALDVASIRQVGSTVIGSNMGDMATVTVAIVDDDMQAVVDPAFPSSNLHGIPADSSLSTIVLDCPDLAAFTVTGTLIDGNGTALDPLIVEFEVTNNTGSNGGVDLLNHAWITVIDAESTADSTIYLDNNLTPLPAAEGTGKKEFKGHVTLLK